MSHLYLFLLLFAALLVVVLWRLPRKPAHLAYAVGIRTLADRFTELIPAGATLPFVFSDHFHNAADFQDDVVIELMQLAGGALHRIALITLDSLPERPMGAMDVEIRLIVGRDKRMRVMVHAREAGVLETYGPYVLDGDRRAGSRRPEGVT
jgi:molecular chaperone DnaK (HSP70)